MECPESQTKEFGTYPVYKEVLLQDFLLMYEKHQSRTFERLIWQQYRGQTGGKSLKVDQLLLQ